MEDGRPDDSPTRRLVRRLGRHRPQVALSLVLAVGVSLLSAITLGSIVPFFSLVIEQGEGLSKSLSFLDSLGSWGRQFTAWAAQDRLSALGLVVAVLVVLTVLKGFLTFAHDYVTTAVCQRTQLDLAEDLFDRLTKHDETTLARVGLSNLTARFSYDLDITGKALGTILGALVLEPVRFVAYLVLAVSFSWKLTLSAVVLVPVILLIARGLGRRIRRSAEGMLEKRALLLGRVQETVAALPVVQVYGQEQRERDRFRGVTGQIYAWAKRLARLEATSAPMLEVAAVLATAPVLLLGGWLVLRGEMEASHCIAVYAFLPALYAPLRKAVGASNRMQGGIAGAVRIFETMALRAEVSERPGAAAFPPTEVGIEWQGVTVTYPDGRTALRSVNVTAPAGRTTAFVGPSGAGKTTLLHMVPRLLDPTAGAVTLDGRDLRDASLASLRGRMALVTQDARLFGGTLAENVAYARPGASRDEIEAAGRVARVDEIVDRLPRGWDTVLEESGKGLSGGERQRIAIARAVLRDPEVLLLDEPTSALDPENERLVQAALGELCRGRTTLVVAHRLETVEHADHVVVLRDGLVETQGDPATVARESPTFRQLFGPAPAHVD